jgi:amino acid transporter
MISILFFAAVSWALANQAGLLQNLSLASVSRLFVYGLVCAALPVLRRQEGGDVPPPLFRAPMGTGLAVIGVAVSLALATRIDLREAATLGLTVALATAYWWLSPRRTRT